jgi:hypothetical protein
MKKVLLVLAAAAAAFAAYRYVVVEAPTRACRDFLRAWANEDTASAAAWTSGDVARKAVEQRILRGVVRWPMDALRGSRLEIESRENAADGTVVVTSRQRIRFDPPGVTSAVGGAAEATVRHVARLRRTSEGWRVVEWAPAFLDARAIRVGG